MRVGMLIQNISGAVLLGMFCLAAAPATAQKSSDGNHPDPQQLYRDATSTKTVEQCTDVIQRIEHVLAGRPDKAQQRYFTNLLAWVYNRRGEMHAHDATTLAGKPTHENEAKAKDKLATADFKKALELAPERWKSWHNLAVCDALSGRLDQAVTEFSKVIELRPDYVDAWFNRAEVRFEQGQFARAVSDYDEAIGLQPTDASLYARRGNALFQLRDFDKALADYDHAIRLAPSAPGYIVDRGDVYRATGQWEKAAADYRRAIKLAPQFGRAYQSAAWLMATCADAMIRDSRLAVEAAQKAIALDGDGNFVYLDTLAAAYANAARYNDAVETARRAIAAAPARFRASLRRRLALYEKRQPYRQHVGKQPPARQARTSATGRRG